jgi:predicted nucleic acid-binding protein
VAPRVVLDANVLVAALRSNRGASFRLVSEIDSGRFEVCVSVPLVLEYEATLVRQARSLGLTRRDVSDFLDYVCSVARRRQSSSCGDRGFATPATTWFSRQP